MKGTNGFLGIGGAVVGRLHDDPDFWNPKGRSPICFNPPRRKDLCAHLPDEDQDGPGRKIEDGDRLAEEKVGLPVSPGRSNDRSMVTQKVIMTL